MVGVMKDYYYENKKFKSVAVIVKKRATSLLEKINWVRAMIEVSLVAEKCNKLF